MRRLIRAKYAGFCADCQKAIAPDDDIWWGKGEDVLCPECHERREENDRSPVKPVQDGVTVRFRPPPAKPLP